MGAYVTNADVVTRLGSKRAYELTADSGTTPDTVLIDKVIAEVEGGVHSAVRRRTDATVTQAEHPSTFALLAGTVMDLVIYRLALRRPPVPDDWKAAHEQAVKWLGELVEGKRELPDAALAGQGSTWDSEEPDAGRAHMV